MTKPMININANQKFQGYLALPESGAGPGLLLIQEIFGVNHHIKAVADKYAKQGYVVLAPDLFYRLEPGFTSGYEPKDMPKAFKYYNEFNEELGLADLQEALAYLKNLPSCTGKLAVMGYCLGGKLTYRLATTSKDIAAAVSYYGGGIDNFLNDINNLNCPIIFHFGAKDSHIPLTAVTKISEAVKDKNSCKVFVYDADHGFNCNERGSYDDKSAQVAFERSLGFMKNIIGPDYDLNTLWDNHTKYEFDEPNLEATLATMTKDAYVNHIPTLTGGSGLDELRQFYGNHFIKHMPKDTKITLINRSITSYKVIDELVFSFTHDSPNDFMLPCVPPTHKFVEIPLVAIVTFAGDKITCEHIYWDQASLLAQIGLLKTENLPVVGNLTAKKRLDQSIKANELIKQ